MQLTERTFEKIQTEGSCGLSMTVPQVLQTAEGTCGMHLKEVSFDCILKKQY